MSKSRPTLPAQMNAIDKQRDNFFDEGKDFLAETLELVASSEPRVSRSTFLSKLTARNSQLLLIRQRLHHNLFIKNFAVWIVTLQGKSTAGEFSVFTFRIFINYFIIHFYSDLLTLHDNVLRKPFIIF